MTFSMASDEDGTDTKTAGPDVDATDTEDDGTIEDATVVDDVDLDAAVDGIDADSTGIEIDEPNEVETNVLKDNPIDGYLSDADDAADPAMTTLMTAPTPTAQKLTSTTSMSATTTPATLTRTPTTERATRTEPTERERTPPE